MNRSTQDLSSLYNELSTIETKIKKLQPANEYTAQVAKSFHLGRVGGSGKNTYRLNRHRERELERTIDLSKQIITLYNRKKELERNIKYIESGQQERDKTKEINNNQLRAQYWKNLKVGDVLEIGNPNGNPIITKKNAKSCETGKGCKWSAAEIIGKSAAALL